MEEDIQTTGRSIALNIRVDECRKGIRSVIEARDILNREYGKTVARIQPKDQQTGILQLLLDEQAMEFFENISDEIAVEGMQTT